MTGLGSRRWTGRLALMALVAPVSMMPISMARAASAAPGWVVNKPASHLRFSSSVGGAPFTGSFGSWNAAIRFDPKNLAGSSVTVRIDMASARTGAAERDEALPGGDWFATAKFAQANFTATSFKDLGGGRYQALGSLTIRGTSRPLAVTFKLAITGDQARMSGTAVVDRHAFGIGQGQFAAADTVPFAVQVGIDIVAKRG